MKAPNRPAFLWLDLHVTCGDSPEGTAIEMAKVAAHLQLGIQVNFNGVQMLAMPGDSAETIHASFEKTWNAKLPTSGEGEKP